MASNLSSVLALCLVGLLVFAIYKKSKSSDLSPSPMPSSSIAMAQPQVALYDKDKCKPLSEAYESRLWEDCLASVHTSTCLPLNEQAKKSYLEGVRFCAYNNAFRNLAPRKGSEDFPVEQLIPRKIFSAPTPEEIMLVKQQQQ